MPARPMPTSATRCWKPSRSAADAPDWPWSLSMTTIVSAGQPKRHRPLAQRRIGVAVDSVFSITWRRVLWRTYR